MKDFLVGLALLVNPFSHIMPFSVERRRQMRSRNVRAEETRRMDTALGLAHLLLLLLLLLLQFLTADAMDPPQALDWHVEYMQMRTSGTEKRIITINGQFPGPQLRTTTNNIISLTVHNGLDEPFLLTWNGIHQRRNAWQDGVLGTNCPILPGHSWTYEFRVKDQVGSFSYFPSTSLHRSAGGFGSIRVDPRRHIASPFSPPVDDFAVLIGDWYKADHKYLRASLDYGYTLPEPDEVRINGHAPLGALFTVEKGRTYRFRVSNIGSTHALNFRIEKHQLLLVETEGSYVEAPLFDSVDVHVGQSCSVLVTMHQDERDYYVVASTRFVEEGRELHGVGVLHYSSVPPQFMTGTLPPPPSDPAFSVNQARSITTWNLMGNTARPNVQGSYHDSSIPIATTLVVANFVVMLFGRRRFAVNNVSHWNPTTPLKLADYYHLPNIFQVLIAGAPPMPTPMLAATVVDVPFRALVEVVFQNKERTPQSWHVDGHSFFVVGFGTGLWNETARAGYNLHNAVSRSTTQVYPSSWTAVLMTLNNPGLWNIRSAELQRQYLGQEVYLRVKPGAGVSWKRKEHPPPVNLLLCGQATKLAPQTLAQRKLLDTPYQTFL